MLKIVVLDSGFGGELFADKLRDELGIVEIIRVIDWRNADKYLHKKYEARTTAEAAMRPYLNKVDLIVVTNYYLATTSLKYFRHKYPKQKFVGISLVFPSTFIDRSTVVLTTQAMSKTIKYRRYVSKLHRHLITMVLDEWLEKIDDGELTEDEIRNVMLEMMTTKKIVPSEIILACAHFNDIKETLQKVFNNNIKIHDSFNDLYNDTCKALKIRGAIKKTKAAGGAAFKMG